VEIKNIKDLDDGRCELDCEFTNKEIKILINYAVTNLLKEMIEREEAKDGK